MLQLLHSIFSLYLGLYPYFSFSHFSPYCFWLNWAIFNHINIPLLYSTYQRCISNILMYLPIFRYTFYLVHNRPTLECSCSFSRPCRAMEAAPRPSFLQSPLRFLMFFVNICCPIAPSLHFKLLPTCTINFLYARSTLFLWVLTSNFAKTLTISYTSFLYLTI